MKKRIAAVSVLLVGCAVQAESLEQTAREKMAGFSGLIRQAESAGLDVRKEKMTLRTAEVFLKYASWDEAHITENTEAFKQTVRRRGQDNSLEQAEGLPDFERSEIVLMLDASSDYLKKMIKGEVVRKPVPVIDWSKVTLDGDQLICEGRPVFLLDWSWKPKTPELTEYHGQLDGFFLSPTQVENKSGKMKRGVVDELKNKPSGTAGFIFINNKGVPKWTEQAYGPGFKMREDTFTGYDIDNPGAREMMGALLKGTVPYMAGRPYTQLGYMLCNEPHFFTTEKADGTLDWASGPVSDYTVKKFKAWLKKKHTRIADLNKIWGTSYGSFDAVTVKIPMSEERMLGTPQWVDWMTFNMDRATDWYSWMKAEVRKHDPDARVHLKIMPNLWTKNARGHGIDLEALTRLSDIIGNDAGSAYTHMWKKQKWMDEYSFEWDEICMAHDFMKSVSPNKIMFNSESHFLSSTASRSLNMPPEYARAAFWLAHTHGLSANQVWYWSRREDGAIRGGNYKGYAASNNQQPRIVNEVHSTVMDLNAHAEEIVAMQRQRKPLRIFYSLTSALNKPDHMDDVFALYESLNFDGIPLGFATEGILNKQDSKNWDGVLVYKTEFVTQAERNALQAYLDKGGMVMMDQTSLKKDEYGRSHPPLNQSRGKLVVVASLKEIKQAGLQLMQDKDRMPEVQVIENRGVGRKYCTWKCVKNAAGNEVISIVNLGKTDADLSFHFAEFDSAPQCRDLLNGVMIPSTLTLKPFGMLFIELIL